MGDYLLMSNFKNNSSRLFIENREWGLVVSLIEDCIACLLRTKLCDRVIIYLLRSCVSIRVMGLYVLFTK